MREICLCEHSHTAHLTGLTGFAHGAPGALCLPRYLAQHTAPLYKHHNVPPSQVSNLTPAASVFSDSLSGIKISDFWSIGPDHIRATGKIVGD